VKEGETMSDDQRTKEGKTMSDDQRTDAITGGGDDAGGASDAGAPGGARGTAAPDAGTEGAEGTYPAEKLDLSGGTSDGDTPVGHASD